MKQVIRILHKKYADRAFAYLAPDLRFGQYAGHNPIGGLPKRPQMAIDEIPEDAYALVLISADDFWQDSPDTPTPATTGRRNRY